MIRINLLPEEMRGRRGRAPRLRAEGPALWVIGVLVLIAAVNGAFLWWILWGRNETQAETQRLRAELKVKQDQRDAKYKDFQALRDLKKRLENQIEILNSLDPPDRLLWSEKLNMLALVVHPQVFITELAVTEKVTEVETQESIRRRQEWEARQEKVGSPPEAVKVPVITQTLIITAVCTGENERDQMDNALRFAGDLRNFSIPNARGEVERFMDGFNDVAFGDFESTQLEGRDVCRFTYTLTTLPITGGKV